MLPWMKYGIYCGFFSEYIVNFVSSFHNMDKLYCIKNIPSKIEYNIFILDTFNDYVASSSACPYLDDDLQYYFK